MSRLNKVRNLVTNIFYCGVLGVLLQDEGRLPPLPGRVRHLQRPQGGRRKLPRRLQGSLRHRNDRAANNTSHQVTNT